MNKNIFVCQECGQQYAKWQGKCDVCGAWNSLAEEIILEKRKAIEKKSATDQLTLSLEKSIHLNASFSRFSTSIGELDRCFGGENDGRIGMVQGSVVLIGGQPGIGKSTLLTQVVLNIGRMLVETKKGKNGLKNENCTKCSNLIDESSTISLIEDKNQLNNKKSRERNIIMYVCGEESPQQINLRMKRLLKKGEHLENVPLEYVMTVDADEIVELLKKCKPKLLVVDSVQTIKTTDLAGQAGSLGQIKEATDRITRAAKRYNIPTFLVGHVTKDGEIAGPKVLEHMVDVIFELSGERSGELRFLRTLKNRFGANDEVGVFKMTEEGMSEVKNPSEYFLHGSQTKTPGSGVVCILEGTRPILTEVQALVVASQLAMPRRVGRGVDLSRVQILAAVLQKHCGLQLGISDIFLSVVGGMVVKESGIDLGLAVALASSLNEKPLPEKSVFIGEVGLMGEIRAVSAYERRVKEAKRLGYVNIYSFKTHEKVRELLKSLKIV